MDDTNRTKVSCEAPRDFFAELPIDVIYWILERLPVRDAARSSILSTRSRQTWLSIPALTFDTQFFALIPKNKSFQDLMFSNILSVILLAHTGPLTKFHLNIPEFSYSCSDYWAGIGPLLSNLSRVNVKDIALNNGQKLPLMVPSHLFSCLELVKLKLDNFSLVLLPSCKGFPNLKAIELVHITFVGKSLEGFIAGCPLLEYLRLKDCSSCDSVCITTATKLKYFDISGKFESICFRNAPDLEVVSVTLVKMVKTICEATRKELIKFLSNSSKIETLVFGGYFCKFLAAGGSGGLLMANFKSLRVLELSDINSNDLEEFRCAIDLIQSSPSVEELFISFASKSSADHILTYDPGFSLDHLRQVEITSVMGVSMELKLIEFLLLCSPALEILSVERSEHISSPLESKMTRELMSFARASPKAKINYVDPVKSWGLQL